MYLACAPLQREQVCKSAARCIAVEVVEVIAYHPITFVEDWLPTFVDAMGKPAVDGEQECR